MLANGGRGHISNELSCTYEGEIEHIRLSIREHERRSESSGTNDILPDDCNSEGPQIEIE